MPVSSSTKTTKAEWKERTIANGAEKLVYPAAEGEKWIDVNLSNATVTAYEVPRWCMARWVWFRVLRELKP